MAQYDQWQMTAAEVAGIREHRKAAGKKGAAARWNGTPTDSQPTPAALPTDSEHVATEHAIDPLKATDDKVWIDSRYETAEEFATRIYSVWPGPAGDFKKAEKQSTLIDALEQIPHGEWDDVARELNKRLEMFVPGETPRKLLSWPGKIVKKVFLGIED